MADLNDQLKTLHVDPNELKAQQLLCQIQAARAFPGHVVVVWDGVTFITKPPSA